MKNFKILLAFALLAAASSTPTSSPATTSSELPKPSYARTMLKVSRSLPSETEELKVRTSEGNVATLIVKRREKATEEPASTTTTTTTTTQAPPVASSTSGYQSAPDSWSRLQTWSSVDQDESKNWVPVSRGFESWKPVEQPFSSPEPSVKPTSWLVADNLETSRSFQTIPADGDSNERIIRYTFLPHDPRASVRTNIGANLMKNRDAKNVPAEVVIRSEINVKPQPGQPQVQPKRLPMTIDPDGIPVVHGRRVPDEPIDKIQVWRNARVINDKLVTDPSLSAPTTTLATSSTLEPGQSFERFFEDVNRRYSKPSDEDSFKSKAYRNEVLAAEIYETAEDTYRPSIRKRMLQPEVAAIYPNSRLYSPPETQKASASIVKPGTRAPVLQYAHPELGVQPAKIVKNEKRRTDEMAIESPMRPQYTPQQSHHGEQRQKKKYVLNDKNIVDSNTYKNYYPYQHFYGLKRPMVEPPFWIKISENLKNGFNDGVNKVSELTKPVFDPLMEATRKISENLGLSRSRSQDPAQDKIGSVATGSSVLIPALGLVASGAALGIGAVAVGRYLDVDVLKRSNNGGAPVQMTEENQRALDIISELQQDEASRQTGVEGQADANGVYILVQENGEGDVSSRAKRSSDVIDDDARRMQRKGADSIAEILEIDVPSRSIDDVTADEANDLHVENEEGIAKAIVQQTLEAIVSSSQLKKDQPSQEKEAATRTRRRRSLSDAELDDALQNLENAEIADVGNQHIPGDWTNTPCAKRIFCDAVVKRGSDAYIFMEKKMAGLLKMIQPGAAVQVSSHFDEVMEAVRRHDCSVFSCPQARPANVFF